MGKIKHSLKINCKQCGDIQMEPVSSHPCFPEDKELKEQRYESVWACPICGIEVMIIDTFEEIS